MPRNRSRLAGLLSDVVVDESQIERFTYELSGGPLDIAADGSVTESYVYDVPTEDDAESEQVAIQHDARSLKPRAGDEID